MLDIHFIREHIDLIKEAAKKKKVTVDIDRLVEVDDARRKLVGSIGSMRGEQNNVTDQIPKTQDLGEKEQRILEMKDLKEKIKKQEEELRVVMEEWRSLMLTVPNIPDMSVPVGDSDKDSEEIKTWGEKKPLEFTPKDHMELMTNTGMVDFERGVKLSGFRGYVLRGDGALLSFALWNFVKDELLKKGFDMIIPPSLLRKEAFVGTGYLPQGEEDLYKTQDESYLSGTAEVPIMGLYMDEEISIKDLPLKVMGFSPAYRREAGSYGKDAKGLIRVHEFYKIEQVVLCEANHEESVKWHEELLLNAEEIMQKLGLHYRVVVNCSGDLGLGQVKKYDIEAWVPSELQYRETHSCSYFHDFQTRRLNIRYRDNEGALRYAHSLNNTAIATPRILAPLIEQYQERNGSITIPEVLQPYIGKGNISL